MHHSDASSVRIEEYLNYFTFKHDDPTGYHFVFMVDVGLLKGVHHHICKQGWKLIARRPLDSHRGAAVQF